VVRVNRGLRGAARFAALAVALAGAPAWAGGFAIHEAGAKANTFAGAFSAQADDLSAMFFNPAGMTQQKSLGVQIGDTLIIPDVNFHGTDPFPGNVYADMKSQIFFPPNFYLAYPVDPKFVVSLGSWFPYGLSTAWDNQNTFPGRFVSQRVDLRTYALSLQGAYQVSDWLSIGGGPELRIGDVKLQRNAAVVNPFTRTAVDAVHIDVITDGFNTGMSWAAGVQVKPCARLRLGLSHHAHTDIEFTGSARFYQISTGNAQLDAAVAAKTPFGQKVPASTVVQFPSLTMFGAAYDVTDRLTFEADAYYTSWKVFDETLLHFGTVDNKPVADVDLKHNWSNVWRFSTGLNYQVTKSANAGVGFVYDQTPQPDSDVSPLLPDNNRVGFTVGGGYHWGSSTVEVSNLFLFFHERTTTTNSSNFNGTYKEFADLLVLNFRHSF
jgi:long-chain fatty acid transport protein